MLLIKSDRDFQEVLRCAFTPLAILPASLTGEARDASKARANDMAVDARIAGFGVTVSESKDGQLFVFVSSNESQVVGFVRKMLAESRTAEPWFHLLRAEKGPLLTENADRKREDCALTNSGFIHDGHAVEIVASYIPAQRNTGWLHSRGHHVGETL
jgi:hypothetical protein